MEIAEQLSKWAAILILVVIGLLIMFFLLNQLTGGLVVRFIVCGMMYMIPFGSTLTTLTQGCAALPG